MFVAIVFDIVVAACRSRWYREPTNEWLVPDTNTQYGRRITGQKSYPLHQSMMTTVNAVIVFASLT